jgi:hypothetical protein
MSFIIINIIIIPFGSLGACLVTTAWRILRFRMEKMASRYGGVSSEYSEYALADSREGWTSSLGVGRAVNPSPLTLILLRNAYIGLGRIIPSRRCVDNIKMVLGDIGWDGINWIGLA